VVSSWEHVTGETPIDPSGLRLRHRGSVTNRRELAVVEALNISKAVLKYLASKPSSRSAPFDYAWFLKLHKEMFGDVWKWAGIVRTHDLTLGVPHPQIFGRLMELVGNLHSWSKFGHPVELQAVRLHHESVRIHPFENGNGRWARLLANIWLKRHDMPIVAWPDTLLGPESTARAEYLAAIRAADEGNYGPLTAIHRRFTAGG